jgi:DNA-binding transcriptional MerR regulator
MAQGKAYKPNDADRLFVERAVKAGTKIETIAECLNLCDDTLRKHYRYEITVARHQLINKAVGVLDDSLTDGSLDAAKYVLGRVAGWSEKGVIDHTSSDGTMTPKPTVIEFIAPKMPDESAD